MMLAEKKHINEPLNLTEHTNIPGVLSYNEDIPTNSFVYKSPEGLHVSRAGVTSRPLTAEIHFTPKDATSDTMVGDLSYLPENRRETFRKKAVVDLVVSLNNLVNFVRENPNTVLANISYMNGHTNKEMALFLQKRLGIETSPAVHPVTNKLSYYFEITFSDLEKGVENLKSNSPFIMEILNRKLD